MSVATIKQRISESIVLKALLTALVVAILFFYFKLFFTTGIDFDDTFLKKEVVSADNHYLGKSAYGGIHITVKGIKNVHGSAEVIYRLPNNINRQYTVNFKDAGNWEAGIENIKDADGKIVFDGEYRKGSPLLLDKNGQPMFEDNVVMIVNGESPYNADYKISLKNVADLATFANETIRGQYVFLFIAVLVFVITAIDVTFPLFFFTLEHFWDVKDPEPSDLYVAVQRAMWYISPIIAVILLIVAIC